ncbi:ABC transporter ATP-binding protein [Albimonas sp. CAU 1670]|uniref:ABC transporter ATP-binding protein n=1 Tax=Albimonas sp. CAU 1670 TaxID=3032599 RepID=UPI0023DABB04|nr:ABC transporter ATP-binding protein [Albimonas sp. CAU 1670]MDF2235687.1 ABC transporter ATP-binding protein [Albimonas sp. CAU 1670]
MSQAMMLEVEGLRAGYGDAEVLFDVTLALPVGRVAAVVGANGAGKTTLLSALIGLIPPRAGTVRLLGDDVTRLPADRRAARGMTLVPEGGRLFPFMSVQENLELGAYSAGARGGAAAMLEAAMTRFPVLRDRRRQLAGRLSGGERQMCAIARALMCRPRLLLLDEPSVGLSPLMAETVLETVSQLARDEGLTVLIVEQRVTEVLEIADEAHVLDHGRISLSGAAAALKGDPQVREAYMGL